MAAGLKGDEDGKEEGPHRIGGAVMDTQRQTPATDDEIERLRWSIGQGQ